MTSACSFPRTNKPSTRSVSAFHGEFWAARQARCRRQSCSSESSSAAAAEPPRSWRGVSCSAAACCGESGFPPQFCRDSLCFRLMTLRCGLQISNKSLMKHEVHLALSAFLCFHTTLETTAPIFLFQFFVSVFLRYGKCNDLMHLHFL